MRNLNIDSLKFYLFIGVFLFHHAGLFCPIVGCLNKNF